MIHTYCLNKLTTPYENVTAQMNQLQMDETDNSDFQPKLGHFSLFFLLIGLHGLFIRKI